MQPRRRSSLAGFGFFAYLTLQDFWTRNIYNEQQSTVLHNLHQSFGLKFSLVLALAAVA